MTLYLSSDDVRALCTQGVAARAAQAVLEAQAAGDYQLPPRYDINLPNGFFRVMPAAVAGYMGLKIMTLARGIGNRYLLALYEQASGDLVALLDADEVTRLRTAATTAAAGQLLKPRGTPHVGVIGTGFEAAGHLRALAHTWNLSSATVFSRSSDRREAFAARMGDELGITVAPAASSAEALSDSSVAVLCTKSTEPVVSGSEFARGAVVLSIGSTRPDLRELDVETFGRSAAVLVDDPVQILRESGDVVAAVDAGALRRDQIVGMGDWAPVALDDERDLLTFKSVGTALQDLVLAAELVRNASASGFGQELGELAGLKSAVVSA